MKDETPSWLQNPKITLNHPSYQRILVDYDVAVVGAGIAGAAAAFKFAEAGLKVVVLEKEKLPAKAGSGNLQGMLYLKLSPSLTYQNDLLISGFATTSALLKCLTARGLLKKGEDWDDCGLIQLSKSEKKKDKQAALGEIYSKELLYFVDQAAASKIAGAELSSGGLLFPQSGWVSPQSLVQALLSHPNIVFKGESPVSKVEAAHLSPSAPLWEITTPNRKVCAKVVILAMADRVTELYQCQDIPFTVVRGQTTTAVGDCGLSVVVSGEGYIAPAKMFNGVMKSTFGATFHRHQPAGDPTDSEHIENIEMLEASSSEVVARLGLTDRDKSANFQSLAGRAATRASAMGSIPIVGPIANRSLFLQRFEAIRLDAKAIPNAEVPWELGLYLTTAHGSRGMITASIAAEILYDYICGDVDTTKMQDLRYPQAILSALHPNRFYYRELRFNQ